MKEKQGIGRLLEIAGERSDYLTLSGLLSVVSSAFMLIPYVSVYFILADLLKRGDSVSSLQGSNMIHWAFVAIVAVLLGVAFLYASSMMSHIAAYRILYGLRARLTEHIGKLHLGYLNRNSTGAIKKTLEQNVEKIEKFIAHQIPDFVGALATVIIMMASMFFLNTWMAIACLSAVALAFCVQFSMMSGDRGRSMARGYYDALERINSSAIEYVRGMPAVKVFGQTVSSFKKFYKDMVDYCDLAVSFSDQFQNGFILFKTLLVSFAAFVLPVGVFLLSRDSGNMSLGLKVLFFIVMVPAVSAPLFKLLSLSSSLRDISEGVRRIDSIFAQKMIVEPSVGAKPHGYDIQFKDVSFFYDRDEKVPAISSLSFTARQGEITALVGPSGSGKSTVANLIPRFWDVTEGAISIGGVDVRDMTTKELMSSVSFVFQDTFLFYDTVYENISMGRPEATEEEVYEAARAAQCHCFIEKLSNGYDTKIGEGGVFLSGGEQQRISVARAILKNSPILVLDEATAFADPENEYKMQKALKELIRDKTVIVIAHRLSTIKNSNKILVLNDGCLVEEGVHSDLLDLNGLYKTMWDAYSKASNWGLRS